MLINYLKITLKVLGRNRFFTFVSLFGIVFTLLILLVLTSFIDHLAAPHYPDVNRDRSLYVGYMRCMDTEKSSQRSGPLSYHFINTYIRKVETPHTLAIASMFSFANAYSGSKRLKLSVKYTNNEYWDVTAFDFREGKPFNRQNIDNSDNVAVINEKTRDSYFGAGVEAVGKSIVVENASYRVIGVVKDVPVTRLIMAADIYLPYTLNQSQIRGNTLNGNFVAILVAKNKADLPKIRQEFADIISRIPMPMTDDGFTFNRIDTGAKPYMEYFLSIMLNFENASRVFYTGLSIFMLLFMLLPAINLVNLNSSRIMERSSEIGVRKAFGASSGKLVVQFLIENIFITLIGGVLALVLAVVVLNIFNNSGLIPGADLVLNAPVFITGIIVCFVFGLLSGVVPAFRMSRLHVIDALRGGEQ